MLLLLLAVVHQAAEFRGGLRTFFQLFGRVVDSILAGVVVKGAAMTDTEGAKS